MTTPTQLRTTGKPCLSILGSASVPSLSTPSLLLNLFYFVFCFLKEHGCRDEMRWDPQGRLAAVSVVAGWPRSALPARHYGRCRRTASKAGVLPATFYTSRTCPPSGSMITACLVWKPEVDNCGASSDSGRLLFTKLIKRLTINISARRHPLF